MRATSKPRGALEEEGGPSDLDHANLTDYQPLRAGFFEVPAELYVAKKWQVVCA